MLFKKLQFKHKWRHYQATVLRNFSKHIEDNHFHIVAPPGSGKTILGLEIIKRIGKKTLVLAPTLTIRNQWNERLQSFFTENEFTQISFDIKNPSEITFSTYQALHSFYKTFDTDEAYFKFFLDEQIEVLLLDEAHHLKNAWWKCLYNLKEQHNQTVVALTATPPYDSENAEIQKYFKLCAEIDDEIVVPDLVKEKNLAPHQDLVYLSKPEDDELASIQQFKQKIQEFVTDILKDETFINFIIQHRFYKYTSSQIEAIYKNTDAFSAFLIFLNAAQQIIPQEKLAVLGFNEEETIDFPAISNEWIEILFQFLLVTDREELVLHEDYLNTIEKRLRVLSAFSKNKVNLTGDDLAYKSLINSPSKLKSIVSIVRQEQKNLQDDLRCVILTDYIRKEYLNLPSDEYENIQKMGVVPIFFRIKDVIFYKEALAVLTGSLVIIHSKLVSELEKIDALDNYTISYLKPDDNFVIITPKSASQKNIVSVITQLFEAGHIKVLIGTKSLLGEGWDAPCINSLILASVVGSYVSSNQMRGRAIRIDQNNPNKVGLIWHLACLDTTDANGGKDMKTLERRFYSFMGISKTKDRTIKTGMTRLDFPETIYAEDVETLNVRSLQESENRNAIAKNWEKAIYNGTKTYQQLTFLNKEQKKYKPKYIDYIHAISFGMDEIWLIFCLVIAFLFATQFIEDQKIIYFIYASILSVVVWFVFKMSQLAKHYLKYELVDQNMYKKALVVLDTLYALELISSPRKKVIIKTIRQSNSDVICTISGVNKLESKLFLDALNEILLPVDNPKYLLIRSTWIRKKVKHEQFITVPEIFGNNKSNALIFQKYWNRHVKKVELVYTRNIKGRKFLLKARLKAIKRSEKAITRKDIIWK